MHFPVKPALLPSDILPPEMTLLQSIKNTTSLFLSGVLSYILSMVGWYMRVSGSYFVPLSPLSRTGPPRTKALWFLLYLSYFQKFTFLPSELYFILLVSRRNYGRDYLMVHWYMPIIWEVFLVLFTSLVTLSAALAQDRLESTPDFKN